MRSATAERSGSWSTIREEKASLTSPRAKLCSTWPTARRVSPRPPSGCAKAACRRRGLSLVAVERGQHRRHGPALACHRRAGASLRLLLGPLAVHPDHRNRGIGSALVRRAIARARLAGHGADPSGRRCAVLRPLRLFGCDRPAACGCPGRSSATGCWRWSCKPGALDGRARPDRRRPASSRRSPTCNRADRAPNRGVAFDAAYTRGKALTPQSRGLFRFAVAANITSLLLLEACAMTDWPVHARISGPIVMIGFGSIGKGTLPLIERHFEYDKSRFVVIDPEDKDRKLLDERGIRFIHQAVTRDNYRKLLRPAAHRGRRPGLLRQPLGRHLLARHHGVLPRDRRALHRHRGRALGRLLF